MPSTIDLFFTLGKIFSFVFGHLPHQLSQYVVNSPQPMYYQFHPLPLSHSNKLSLGQKVNAGVQLPILFSSCTAYDFLSTTKNELSLRTQSWGNCEQRRHGQSHENTNLSAQKLKLQEALFNPVKWYRIKHWLILFLIS